MSAAALARCRKLQIRELSTGRFQLDVLDPGLGDKVVDSLFVRTESDLHRYKMALMKKFQIPQENISQTSMEDTDADSTQEESPEVHEHRGEVLEGNEGEPKPGTKQMPKLVPVKARRRS